MSVGHKNTQTSQTNSYTHTFGIEAWNQLFCTNTVKMASSFVTAKLHNASGKTAPDFYKYKVKLLLQSSGLLLHANTVWSCKPTLIVCSEKYLQFCNCQIVAATTNGNVEEQFRQRQPCLWQQPPMVMLRNSQAETTLFEWPGTTAACRTCMIKLRMSVLCWSSSW